MTRPMPPAPTGYAFGHRLGGGPLSDVFAARDPAGRLCAVKLLRPEAEHDPTALALFRREGQVGLSVRHANLVRYRAAHVRSAPYYVVTDLLDGETLRHRLDRDGYLDLGEAVTVARQAAEGLAALHAKGWIHGDVKPENVFLAADGTTRVIDLGFVHRPGEIVEIVGPGYVLGTANYVAPELCRTESRDDAPADVFSLGVTLFETLTGTLPYPRGSVEKTMVRHRDERAASLGEYEGPWPVRLIDAVGRMTQRDPRMRIAADAAVRELFALEAAALRRAG